MVLEAKRITVAYIGAKMLFSNDFNAVLEGKTTTVDFQKWFSKHKIKVK